MIKLGRIIKVLWNGAEVKKDIPYHHRALTYLEFSRFYVPPSQYEIDKAIAADDQVIKNMQHIRVGNKVYVEDESLGKIIGVIREETSQKFVVEFEKPPRVGAVIYFESDMS